MKDKTFLFYLKQISTCIKLIENTIYIIVINPVLTAFFHKAFLLKLLTSGNQPEVNMVILCELKLVLLLIICLYSCSQIQY